MGSGAEALASVGTDGVVVAGGAGAATGAIQTQGAQLGRVTGALAYAQGLGGAGGGESNIQVQRCLPFRAAQDSI